MSDELVGDRATSENNISTSDLAEAARKRSRTPDSPQRPSDPFPSQAAIITPNPESASPRASVPTIGQQDGNQGPLFSGDETNHLRSEWDAIQGEFVDEPRRAVQEADQLVAKAMKRLAEIFADERKNMEHQWEAGDGVSTEDLRIALRRYRSFFGRLLAV
jgi:hypothetical protein